MARSPMDVVCPRNKWANGDYLFRLRYSRDGSEYFSNDFGFTIGGKGVPDNLHRIDKLEVVGALYLKLFYQASLRKPILYY